MKKVFSILTAISVVFSFFSTVTAFAEKQENQYVVNGDFETGDYTGWRNRTIPEGSINELRQDETGNWYLRMEGPADKVVRISSDLVQNGLAEKDLVTLSFDLKIDELLTEPTITGGAGVAVVYRNKNNDPITTDQWYRYHDLSKEWRHYEIDLLMPETATGLSIQLRAVGGGKMSWDNFKLTDGKNKTDLTIAHSSVPLASIPDGINSVTAKMHYVSESGNVEAGNLVFAAYCNGVNGEQTLAGLTVTPFKTAEKSDSIFVTSDIALPDDAKNISVKAYIWKNGSTLEPVADSELLPKKGRSPVYDRFVTEKMRGVYTNTEEYFYQEDVMNRILDSGINTIIYIPNTYGDFEWLEQNLTDVEKFAIENNIMVFPKVNYSSNRIVSNVAYGAYHPGREHNFSSPCPLAKEYWEKSMFEPLAMAAKHPGITGGIFDMEMYTSESAKRYDDPCLCDACVKHFALDNPSDAAQKLTTTESTTRLRFIKENSLIEEYRKWQKNELTIITTDLRERLHAINPDFIIGLMPYHSWLPGVDQGLGTEEMPLLIFAEAYSTGAGRAHKEMAEMETANILGFYTKGVGPSEDSVPLAKFKDRVIEVSKVCGGYFLYRASYMENNYAAATPDTETTYYAELKKANEELDKILGIN